MKFVDELQNYLKARYPLILIKSTEEDRLTMDLKLVAKTLGHDLITWSIASGLKSENKQFDISTVEPKKRLIPVKALQRPISRQSSYSMILFPLYHRRKQERFINGD